MPQIIDFKTPTHRRLTITIEDNGYIRCNCGGFLLYGDCAHAEQIRRERELPEQLPRRITPKKLQTEVLQAAESESPKSAAKARPRKKKYKRVTDQLIS